MPKTAMVLRFGAYGDHVICSVLYPVLKEKGYHVTVNSSERGMQIIKNNPHIDEVVIHKTDSIPIEKLEEHYEKLGKKYDKFINLSGSIEGSLLIVDRDPEKASWSKEKRHKKCNRNYYDEMFRIAGYPEITGKNGELYFSSFEQKIARAFRKKYKNYFLVMWSLSGSSEHKSYPYAHYVAMKLLNKYPDTMILQVGDDLCKLLEWEHSRAKCYSGMWNIRKVFSLIPEVDLVIGTETGVLNAAGCYPVPKIILLSHSSEENLTKHWENCVALGADVPCRSCHILHFQMGSCILDEQIGTPICMSKLKAMDVYNAIENVYLKWKENKCVSNVSMNARN